MSDSESRILNDTTTKPRHTINELKTHDQRNQTTLSTQPKGGVSVFAFSSWRNNMHFCKDNARLLHQENSELAQGALRAGRKNKTMRIPQQQKEAGGTKLQTKGNARRKVVFNCFLFSDFFLFGISGFGNSEQKAAARKKRREGRVVQS
jgi:hypothetical protein